MVKTKAPTVFLRPDYTADARKHIEDYLNSEFPDFEKVYRDLAAISEHAEKIIVSDYEGQNQVSAFFISEGDGLSYGVSGLGQTLDLAILSCYVKCALVLMWKFGGDVKADSPVSKPRFS